MAVTVNPPANIGDVAPIQTDVTKPAAVDKYVGLVNAPTTWSANAKAVVSQHQEHPHEPPRWKVN